MRPPTPRPQARRSGARVAAAVGGALVVVLVVGACSGSGTVEAGGPPGPGPAPSDGTAPASPAPPIDPAPPAPDASPSTTCVDGPATTTPWDAGGGRITCSAPDQGSASSPPMTDTTIAPASAAPVPDATHGVLVVSATGGYECPPGQACSSIGVILQGVVEVTGPDGAVVTASLDPMGRAAVRATPGEHRITARVTSGSCAPADAAVVAGETIDVALACSVPAP